MTLLPGILAEIAGVAGEDAALLVAKAVGGTRQYIPVQPGDDHWLVGLVGRDKAVAICQHFAGGSLAGRGSGATYQIPLGPAGSLQAARRSVAKALEQGASAAEAARAGGLHERTAWRLKKRLASAKDSDQGELF